MKRPTPWFSIGLPALFLASPGSLVAAGTEGEVMARYRVVFQRSWSDTTHPQDFPLLAHFSPAIGATHNGKFALFAEGKTASAGIEKLCEEGVHQPLDSEIRSAIGEGRVGALIETDQPIRSVPGESVAEVEVDREHPMVSIAAMIAPSPDWCAVATNVRLLEDGRFVSERSVELYAWDAGTDKATSYRAFDADLQPRAPMQVSESAYFRSGGTPKPVGRVTFHRL